MIIKLDSINHTKLIQSGYNFCDHALIHLETKVIHEKIEVLGEVISFAMGIECTYRVKDIQKFMLLLLATGISYIEVQH